MNYRVVFAPEAEEQLVTLYHYITDIASPEIAARYTESIIRYCNSFQTYPNRGIKRDDIRLGLRVTNYKKHTVIVFDVTSHVVSIIGVFYGGQDFETALKDSDDLDV